VASGEEPAVVKSTANAAEKRSRSIVQSRIRSMRLLPQDRACESVDTARGFAEVGHGVVAVTTCVA
jgi:hypothetical protein